MLIDESFYIQKAEHRRKKLINIFAWLCITGIGVSLIPDIFFGLWQSVLVTLLLALPLTSIPFFNKKFPAYIGATLLLMFLSLLAFSYAALLGKEANLHLYFLFVLLVIPFIIPPDKKILIGFHITHPILFFIILSVNNYSISFIPKYSDITPSQIATFGFVNLILLFLLVPYIVYAIIRSNHDNEIELLNVVRKLDSQNQELMQANAELDRFAGKVSHDIRSPIYSLLGLAKIAKEETDITTLHHYAEMQEKTLKKLENFVGEMLQHARNIRAVLKKEEILFESFFQELINIHKPNDKTSSFLTEIDIKQDTLFTSDLSQLNTIFGNLIANAFRYYDTTKSQCYLKIEGNVYPDKAVLFVKDNGIGIEKEHLPKVFDMFYRANTQTQGTGLGLFLVKESIEKLSGSIKIESEKNVGTTFIIEIPKMS
jgi:signal transduction histidine kinase